MRAPNAPFHRPRRLLRFSVNPMRQHHGPFWFNGLEAMNVYDAARRAVRYHPHVFATARAIIAQARTRSLASPVRALSGLAVHPSTSPPEKQQTTRR